MRVRRLGSRGQSTIEYVLMVAFGAIFALQLVRFFNGVFQDGLRGLEGNMTTESRTGAGFGN